jgi:hypothetical protein
MAQHTLVPPTFNFADKRKANNKSSAQSGRIVSSTLAAATASNDDLDARLTAINGTYFTAKRLDGMTQNDKVYAIRLADDPTSI